MEHHSLNNRAHTSAAYLMEYCNSTRFRPAFPIRARNDASPASFAMSAGQSSSDAGRKPVSPSRTISAFAPTGDAITGSPAAMYCTILNPHLPSVHGSHGLGATPTSPRLTAAAAPTADHATCATATAPDSTGAPAIVNRRRPGSSRAARSSAGTSSLRYVSAEPD